MDHKRGVLKKLVPSTNPGIRITLKWKWSVIDRHAREVADNRSRARRISKIDSFENKALDKRILFYYKLHSHPVY